MTLFTYIDYRQFLKDYFAQQKKSHPNFSYEYFARLGGMRGESLPRMVTNGKRNLSSKTLRKFIRALRLSRRESDYFENLVYYNQATTEKDKDHYFDQLIALRPPQEIKGLNKDQLEYLSNKNYVRIREITALPQFKEDPEWIAAQFSPPLKPYEVKKAIEVLLNLKLLKRDKKGLLCHSEATVQTPDRDNSIELFNYHRSVLGEAKDVFMDLNWKISEMLSLTIPVQEEAIPEIKRMLNKCQEDIVDYVNKKGDNYMDVFQLNMQFFPVTHTRRNKIL